MLTTMKTLAVFTLTFSSCLAGLGLHQWTDPEVVHDGLTQSLVVNCSIVDMGNSTITQAMALFIYKSTLKDPNSFVEAATISAITGKLQHGATLNASVSGHLTIDGQGAYIALKWAYPKIETTGTYKCELVGMADNFHVVHLDTFSKVMDVRPDLLAAVDEIQDHDARIARLETIQAIQTSRLAGFRDSMFMYSATVDGTLYMVSRPMILNTALAESLCKLFGGYLVEFNSQKELDAIEQIRISASAKSKIMLVGLNDEVTEGQWRFREHPGITPTFLSWAEAATDRTKNCAILGTDSNSKLLYAYPCYNNNYNVHVMCEVNGV